jgi:hypothetical protein
VPANAPKADLTAYVASQLPQKLDGPGVSSAVFGAASPNVKGMSDEALGKNIAKLATAMKSNPGKVNAEDFKILKAMLDAAELRSHAQLNSKAPIADLSNRELFASIVAFDTARFGGAKLTKEQEARYSALESEWKKRGTFDQGAELKYLQKEREHVYSSMLVHCTAASAGAASLASHNAALGIAASGLVIAHAAHENAYGALAFEATLAVAARIPAAHKFAEATATTLNAVHCAGAIRDLEHIDHESKQLQIELAKKNKAASP